MNNTKHDIKHSLNNYAHMTTNCMKKLKAMFPETQNAPVISSFKAPIGAPGRAILIVDSQKTLNDLENSKREQRPRAYTLLIVSNESAGDPAADGLVIEDLKNKKLEVSRGLLKKSFYTVEGVHPLSDEQVYVIMNS